MENERVISAIGRIERALSRIETAKMNAKADTLDETLERRHTALKQELQQAIQTIDSLIAKQEA